MTDLIWSPHVTVIGQTKFNETGLMEWMHHNALDLHMLPDAQTPLAKLWEDADDDFALERMAEFGGRHCYRSWDAGRTREDYIKNIIEMGHGSVLEHSSINLTIQGVSRSLTHELVRHRVGVAISQESQRYVPSKSMNFVVPPLLAHICGGAHAKHPLMVEFASQCEESRKNYQELHNDLARAMKENSPGVTSITTIRKRANEAARSHLPNAAETRLLWTPNLRLLRHFLWLRGGAGADLEIRRLACEILDIVQAYAPTAFYDMTTKPGDFGVPVVVCNEHA